MLGDVLTSTIITNELNIVYSDAHLDCLIDSLADAVVTYHPAIDKTIKITKYDSEKRSVAIPLSRKLKHKKYDLLTEA
jgi:heptosyltransferase-2